MSCATIYASSCRVRRNLSFSTQLPEPMLPWSAAKNDENGFLRRSCRTYRYVNLVASCEQSDVARSRPRGAACEDPANVCFVPGLRGVVRHGRSTIALAMRATIGVVPFCQHLSRLVGLLDRGTPHRGTPSVFFTLRKHKNRRESCFLFCLIGLGQAKIVDGVHAKYYIHSSRLYIGASPLSFQTR